MELIAPLVSCLCGRLAEGFGSSVQTQAEGGFSFLGGLAGRTLLDRLEKRRNRVKLQPTETTVLVGAEETLTTIRGHLNGNEVDAVGIVGIGGVGKTTLLKMINNDIYSRGTSKFDKVIFVTVSSEGDVLKVQKEIAKRLGLPDPSDDRDRFIEAVYGALSPERYLLLLDDVWGDLDVREIGVPLPNKENRCKIVLSTRSSDVFHRFVGSWCRPRERARQVDVRKLDERRSWELFRSMVDPAVDLDDPCILPLAEKMVQKCDGLPLALVTVGKTMARSTLAAEWREAERQWEKSPYRLQDMDQVKSSLMFTIDRLERGTLLPCFLYCCLFPEDEEISVDQLIEYWVGEGLLDGEDTAPRPEDKGAYGSIHRCRDKGEIVINKLKDLCLLETGTANWRKSVKMHDLLREVAREVANQERKRFVVDASDINTPDGWEEATRMSLRSCELKGGSLLEMPSSTSMLTLLMQDVTLSTSLLNGFFKSMPRLVVVDLTFSYLGSSRTILTPLSLLSELRYLNLSGTDIRYLPEEVGNLTKLRQLDLRLTLKLEEIPQQAILRLSNLQALNMSGCGYRWGLERGENSVLGAGNNGDVRLLRTSDLNLMDRLQDLRISTGRLGVLESFLNGEYFLLTAITALSLSYVHGLTNDILQSALQNLMSLRQLSISFCPDLTGDLILDGSADKPLLSELEDLELYFVPLSTIIIKENINKRRGVPLQKLQNLKLFNLERLEKLCDPSHCLPSLKNLQVRKCPLLRTLPLNPHSKIVEMHCEQEWWERLNWRQDQRDARRVAELALIFYRS